MVCYLALGVVVTSAVAGVEDPASVVLVVDIPTGHDDRVRTFVGVTGDAVLVRRVQTSETQLRTPREMGPYWMPWDVTEGLRHAARSLHTQQYCDVGADRPGTVGIWANGAYSAEVADANGNGNGNEARLRPPGKDQSPGFSPEIPSRKWQPST